MKVPSIIFKKWFRLKSIKEAYANHISKKATRGIDRIGIKTFFHPMLKNFKAEVGIENLALSLFQQQEIERFYIY